MTPKFSIICACFNHEKYISSFLDSVLAQTYQNFELIIIDDCSTDKTVDIIKTYTDPRIKLVRHNYNKGVNAAMNTGCKSACNDYFVFCSSDDMMEPFALQKYADTFSENDIDAVFVNLSVIDENDQPRQDYENSAMPIILNQPRSFLLRKMFFEGNQLYSPGMAMSRRLMEQLYPFPPAQIIFQDYKIHVELLALVQPLIIPDKLIRYRVTDRGQNLSSATAATAVRAELENSSLMDSFLKIKDISLLQEIFAPEIEKSGILPYPETIPFFLGRMAIFSSDRKRQTWGYHQIMDFYNNHLYTNILHDKYHFTFKDLLGLANCFQAYSSTFSKEKRKLKPYQLLFSIRNSADKKYKELCLLGIKLKFKRKI